MLQELYERFRGISKWPEVNATVTDVQFFDGDRYSPPHATVTFYYRDPGGTLQSGEITAAKETPLYYLQPDEVFSIRCNPSKPEKFYISEAFKV